VAHLEGRREIQLGRLVGWMALTIFGGCGRH
jgi:hypothetical protein